MIRRGAAVNSEVSPAARPEEDAAAERRVQRKIRIRWVFALLLVWGFLIQGATLSLLDPRPGPSNRHEWWRAVWHNLVYHSLPAFLLGQQTWDGWNWEEITWHLLGAEPDQLKLREQVQARLHQGGVHILDPYLSDQISWLELRSPTFRTEMRGLRSRGFPLVIGTPETLGVEADPDEVGATWYLMDDDMEVLQAVVVSVDLAYFRRAYQYFPGRRDIIQREVVATLIHELHGHVAPRILDGILCDDPRRGDPGLDSCVMRRENALRREVGLPEDHWYGHTVPTEATLARAREQFRSGSHSLPDTAR